MTVATIGETKPARLTRSSIRAPGLILATITALVVLFFGLKKPTNNWDIVGYVAVALNADGYRGADLNKATYDSVRSEVSASTFDQLTQGEYRETVYRDPSSLAQQLPFYRIRVVYVGLIRTVHAMGWDYPTSTYIVSAVSAALSVLLLALLARRTGAPVAAVPLVVAFAGFVDIARLSTPDAMACFFSLLTIYALIRRSMWVLVIAALLPLVRTDLLLLSLLVLGHTYVFGQRKYALASAVVACVVYGLVERMNGAYGWLTLFNTSLIHKTAYPATLVPSHAIGDYLRPYAFMAYDFAMHPHFVIYSLALWFLMRGGTRTLPADKRLLGAVFVIPMAFVAAHLLLFPADTYRFFVFAASLVAIGLIGQMKLAAR
ncbi:hypothetical protein [Dyella psychrodurans]|uniref:Glycosyltransferase RgtA/B/C/D-like domain-containing protein n=1 Tax=Dyella psychrodurans TaxID=1927960 RepID=A0A370X2K6_9GAMM|nr:hypothetical protein [Dyella psychrodurans]RDS82629.1 hypothetical protein DWU99_14645 [Dyella psychrodurans]